MVHEATHVLPITKLANRLPEAIDEIENTLRQSLLGRALLSAPSELADGSGAMFGHITGFFSTGLTLIVDVLIILIVGIYVAINPQLYVRGLTLLVPPKARPRATEALDAVGQALGWWLIGQFASMAIIGVLLATPMVVAIILLLQMLYVQDLLNTEGTVLGEKH